MDLRALAGDLKALKTLAGLSGRSKKRRAEEDTVIEAALLAFEGFDEEELEAIKYAEGKGPGSRPRGSNATSRTDYSMSTWARMLRDEATELARPGSAAAILFRKRFRIPRPTVSARAAKSPVHP